MSDRNETKPAQESWHLSYWMARRARRRWINSGRRRDAYIHHKGRFHWMVSKIDYVAMARSTTRAASSRPTMTGKKTLRTDTGESA